MKWSEFFTSSVGKKLVMGLTGIFLILFLVVHAGVNACIWANDQGEMFNEAAHFMGSTIVIRVLEVGLFLGFIVHILQGLRLTLDNRTKRKVGYQVPTKDPSSTWYSRSMGLLGTLLLLFLILHWWHFWVPSRFTGVDAIERGLETHNLYGLMQVTFSQLWVVVVYVIACGSLFWHLLHGFQSAFRTLGLFNNKYLKLLQGIGLGYSLVISVAFALMPVSMYLKWVN